MVEGILEASVTGGDSGPVIALAGEANLTSAGQLSALITAQMTGETQHLTIDLSGLRFIDSASTRVLMLAARTLNERGGNLVLLHPQPPVARVLALIGAEQILTIRGGSHARPRRGDDETGGG